MVFKLQSIFSRLRNKVRKPLSLKGGRPKNGRPIVDEFSPGIEDSSETSGNTFSISYLEHFFISVLFVSGHGILSWECQEAFTADWRFWEHHRDWLSLEKYVWGTTPWNSLRNTIKSTRHHCLSLPSFEAAQICKFISLFLLFVIIWVYLINIV